MSGLEGVGEGGKGGGAATDSFGVKACTVVIKVGTSSLLQPSGDIAISYLARVVEVICTLQKNGHRVVLVSSGAVGVGCVRCGLPRPDDLAEKQAMAAIGQVHLMRYYDDFFASLGSRCAQVLLTYNNLFDQAQYTNAHNTFMALLRMGIVPIVNENDTVAVHELKIGDNDSLGAMVAGMVSADWLFIMTDVDGLYTSNPLTDKSAKKIPYVSDIQGLRMAMRVDGDDAYSSDDSSSLGAGAKARRDARRSKSPQLGAAAGTKPGKAAEAGSMEERPRSAFKGPKSRDAGNSAAAATAATAATGTNATTPGGAGSSGTTAIAAPLASPSPDDASSARSPTPTPSPTPSPSPPTVGGGPVSSDGDEASDAGAASAAGGGASSKGQSGSRPGSAAADDSSGAESTSHPKSVRRRPLRAKGTNKGIRPDGTRVTRKSRRGKGTGSKRSGQWGTGGMGTKLVAAQLASAAGVKCVIMLSSRVGRIQEVIDGDSEGTQFAAMGRRAPNRKRWILALNPSGTVTVDAGAATALTESKSLFAVGVRSCDGTFERGDSVRVCDLKGREIARARVSCSSGQLASALGLKSKEIERRFGFSGCVAERSDVVVVTDVVNEPAVADLTDVAVVVGADGAVPVKR